MERVHWMAGHRPEDSPTNVGVQTATVYVSRQRLERVEAATPRQMARFGRKPLVGDGDGEVISLRLAPGGELGPQLADEDVVAVVWRGDGRCQIGDAGGAGVPIAAGDAIMWPRAIAHTLRAGAQGLGVLAVHLSVARP